MLTLVFGGFSSAGTYYADTEILKALKENKRPFLLVPEQEVMEAERRIADRAEKEGVFCENLTVVSFRRLADLAFREYGGIRYDRLSEGGRLLYLWKITEELAPALKAYKNVSDRSFITMMLSLIDEMRRYLVTPLQLSSVAEKLGDGDLGEKLSDIALIYSAFASGMRSEFSDSENDIERLYDILRYGDFLSECPVFADSFNGFTAPEMNVLGQIMKTTRLTVTLCRPEKDGITGYKTIYKTEKDLLSLAKQNGVKVNEPIRITEENATVESLLIASRLYGERTENDLQRKSDNIMLSECEDRFSEAEYVFCNICELLRKNVRYRDIAIVSRNTADFDGIFDVIAEKYGIPVFYSKRSPLTSSGIMKTVRAAIEVIAGGWKTEDVITYAKREMTGLTQIETEMLESYSVEWSISGSRWTDEYDWNMNPDGYTDETRADCGEYLSEINRIRRKLCSPLMKLGEAFSGKGTVKERCSALYSFVLDSGIYAYYRDSSDKADVTVYNKFAETLDTMVTICGDIIVNTNIFSILLSMCAANTDYGRIPQTTDQVLMGDASGLRLSGRKYIFLVSCEDGVFPKSVTDDSFLSESEKKKLCEYGLPVLPDTADRNDDELFYFLRCAASAGGKLYASYVKTDGNSFPSAGFRGLSSLFPGNPVLRFPADFPKEFRIQTLSASKEIMLSAYGTPLYGVLSDIYKEKFGASVSAQTRLFNEKETVSEYNLKKLYGKTINLSSYRAEAFVKCPFSYYGKYVLKLSERKKATFGANDMGIYIHRILELIVKKLYPDGKENKSYTEKELETITSEITDDVLSRILGKETVMSGRLSALFTRMKRTILMLVKNIEREFKVSAFKPRFFETPIDRAQGDVNPVTVTLPGGEELFVYGTIDRIDTYEKDGDVYVRVVDYKSGSRTHSLKNISYGLDMQMLLYLFAICQTEDKALKTKFGVGENGSVYPAGVLYQSTRLSPESLKKPPKEEDIGRISEKNLVRSGLLLDDPNILDAMEKGLEGNFIPVCLKDGKLTASKDTLVTLEGFGKLLGEIKEKLTEIGVGIRSGNADIAPKKLPSELDPCGYCELKYVCRKPENR